MSIPKHIAIIPDGNRRWAKEKGLPAVAGHRKGAENFEILLDTSRELGIEYFSTWVFSTENWKRSDFEVKTLFDIFRDFTKTHTKKFVKEKIRFIHLGRKTKLPKDLIDTLYDLEDKTKEFTKNTFALGIDYGGHDEIIRTFNKLKKQGLDFTKENVEANLDTANMPMPDLIIRTSGEQRLSGFMLWQAAYAELYFPKVHYPDFTPKHLKKAVEEFSNRKRRFGGGENS